VSLHMKMYEQDEALVEEWQCRDPALTNVADLIMGMLRPLQGRAIDVGCGTGRIALRLAQQGFQVDALDVEAKVLDIARRLAGRQELGIRFVVCDLVRDTGEFANDSYDVAVCSEVLEHVDDWKAMLRVIVRVLKPGGTLIISVPHDPAQFTVIDEFAGHYRRFKATDLLAELDGFQTSYFTTGFPFVRLITWSYTRFLRATGRRHSPQRLWQPSSLYRNVGSRVMYGLDKVDNLFNGLNLGTTLVLRATKPR
jgi:SAM-dependent methyltransferase